VTAQLTPIQKLFEKITPELAWGGSTGKGVSVGVVDSGVERSHPALSKRVKGGVVVREEGRELRLLPYDGADASGHGTACAGIIAGLAPEADLYSVRVLGEGGTGSVRALLGGLKWAVDAGCRVVNLSLGTMNREHLAALHLLADRAYFRNAVIVAAADNSGQESYPSSFSSVISVDFDHITDKFGILYRPNGRVEFVAPGVMVEAPTLGGRNILHTGSSFAAPHVSGLVALILSKHPMLKPFEVKTILHQIGVHNLRGMGERTA
jgi:subtilisin family serine protease